MNTRQCISKNEHLHCDVQHQQYIENASHHIEKIGGLHPGFSLEKWLAAEEKIDQLLTEK